MVLIRDVNSNLDLPKTVLSHVTMTSRFRAALTIRFHRLLLLLPIKNKKLLNLE